MRTHRRSLLIAFIPVGVAACAGSQPSDLVDDRVSNAGSVPEVGVGREARTQAPADAPDASIRPAQEGQGVDGGADEASAPAAGADDGGGPPDPSVGGGDPPASACPPTEPPQLDLRDVELCRHPALRCWTNDDCTAGAQGRCTITWDSKKDCASGTACSYDACTTDAECPSGTACRCAAGPSAQNVCF
jgi:hypothetical protein